MSEEAEKAYKVWLVEQQAAGCWLDPDRLKSDFVQGYESTFCAGHASRDAEVARLKNKIDDLAQDLFNEGAGDKRLRGLLSENAELKKRIKELENKLEMRRNSVRGALERNGLDSKPCQDGIDHVDLITGKIR